MECPLLSPGAPSMPISSRLKQLAVPKNSSLDHTSMPWHLPFLPGASTLQGTHCQNELEFGLQKLQVVTPDVLRWSATISLHTHVTHFLLSPLIPTNPTAVLSLRGTSNHIALGHDAGADSRVPYWEMQLSESGMGPRNCILTRGLCDSDPGLPATGADDELMPLSGLKDKHVVLGTHFSNTVHREILSDILQVPHNGLVYS